MIIDTTGHCVRKQGYARATIRKVSGKLIKTDVYVDAYAAQSYARAMMLSQAGEWTVLIDFNAHQWHSIAPSYTNKTTKPSSFTAAMEDDLISRIEPILEAL